MSQSKPQVVIVAGPNGSGKSTAAPELLRGALGVDEFVNADVIASGLSAFQADKVALKAGRLMLKRLDELASHRVSFAFETTLASRRFARWIETVRPLGYSVRLLFFFLRDANSAVARVEERVRLGGHDVPEDTIRRRYERGLRNFFSLYLPVVDSWRIYDNSGESGPTLIALGGTMTKTLVFQESRWTRITSEYDHV
jgi:predicted ABC-type ATPase